jgi:hypothetical protein
LQQVAVDDGLSEDAEWQMRPSAGAMIAVSLLGSAHDEPLNAKQDPALNG